MGLTVLGHDTQKMIDQMDSGDRGQLSDGYHTFNELYDFRKAYNAMLFNQWAVMGAYSVQKSYRHHDGELCFGGGWFVVLAVLPTGQITNHYPESDWPLFQVRTVDKIEYEYDGHTAKDVLMRIKDFLLNH
jgi:hypothetical protein